ncbi:MAG TPA: Crp/Fnr family transcriptional regulator [Albitalea sp.]
MYRTPIQTHAANDPRSCGPAWHERAALQQGAWFRALPAQAQEAMLAQTTLHVVPAGQPFGRHGIARNDWFAVTRGSVRLSAVFVSGKAFTLSFIGPGEWFGELSAADDLPDIVEAVAQTDCAVLVIRSASMKRLVSQHPVLLQALLQMSYARLAELERVMEELQTLPLAARLARKIVWLMQRQNGASHLRLSQDEWADLVVASRSRVNLVLRSMEREGVLHLERRALSVLSLPRLRELALLDLARRPRAVA